MELTRDQWGHVLASKEDRKQRLDICKKCEHYIKSTTRCQKCGCFMIIKSTFNEVKCPIGKW